MRPAAVRGSWRRKAHRSPLVRFQVRLSKIFLDFVVFLWMNPEQANAVVIRGKKSDGLETLAQTAFSKVVTFVGLYLWKLCVVLFFLLLFFLAWLNLCFVA